MYSSNTHSDYKQSKQPISQQQQKHKRQHQNDNTANPLIVDRNDYIGILNIVAELGREVINGNRDFSTQEKNYLEEDMKEIMKMYATSLGANMQLPNGEPLSIPSLLCKAEDQELLKEKKEWDMKTRDAQREGIQERKQLGKRIEPLIQKAIDIETSETLRGTFDDSSVNELNVSHTLDPKYQIDVKKEFKDSIELLKNMKKESPQRLSQYAEIGRILDIEKSSSSS